MPSHDHLSTNSVTQSVNNSIAQPSASWEASSLLAVPAMRPPQKFHVLVLANGEKDVEQATALAVRFSNHPKIETRAIVDVKSNRLARTAETWLNRRLGTQASPDDAIFRSKDVIEDMIRARDLVDWADLLVLAPINANTMAKMLSGLIDDVVLYIIRSWDVAKKIVLIPGMTGAMWENPMTRKQLFEIRTKWTWIRVMPPILWHYDAPGSAKCFNGWDNFGEVAHIITNQADLMTIGHDVDHTTSGDQIRRIIKVDKHLPPELWSSIFQYVGDWELATKMRVWTMLSIPQEWKGTPLHEISDPLKRYVRELEWTILLKRTPDIVKKLSHMPSKLMYLSSLAVKLIIKFGMTKILSFMEKNLSDVFWASFGSKLLPTKASAVYGRPEILEWWRTSPTFLKKDYTTEAIDGASQAGFVHVLEWWQKSGLPLKYTEAALEQASSKGHILALEWWKEASMLQGSYFTDLEISKAKQTSTGPRPRTGLPDSVPSFLTNDVYSVFTPDSNSPLRLKVGKSIVAAAQNGQEATIRWWDTSGIPYSHSDSVARIASVYGHVNVLETWKELKGEKFAMSFDHQVLVGPTKNGFVRVLEWWKTQTLSSGPEQDGAGNQNAKLKVEYKTCDIEEALEDSVGSQDGEGEAAVRKWWAKNGLNLGVGTSEWMRVKTL